MKKLFFIFISMLLSLAAKAITVTVDGVNYELNESEKTATVVSGNYADDIVIQSEVAYESDVYSVTSIGKKAFQDCYDLTSVEIPGSLTAIDWRAFKGCSGLTSVSIPASVTSVGAEALMDTGWYNSQSDGILYLDGWLIGQKGDVSLGDYTVTDGTKGIADNAFFDSQSMTSLTIPNSVMTIGAYALASCESLSSVSIGNGMTSIRYGAFSSCTNLLSVTIPYGVTTIEPFTFSLCTNLTTVNIPCSVTTIEQNAFMECYNLTTATIPDGVESIGEGAFFQCLSLSSITIPNSVTCIGQHAFYECSSIEALYIGTGVKAIDRDAFACLESLRDVYCFVEEVPATDNQIFYEYSYRLATLHVPAASMDAYKATEPWSNFNEIVALTEQDLSIGGITDGEATEVSHYSLSGQRISQPQKGINIVKAANGLTKKVIVK